MKFSIWRHLRSLCILACCVFSHANLYAAGENPACVLVSGNITLSASSTLTVDIGGPIGCPVIGDTEYDRLTADDLLLQGGTLQIRLVNGYAPAVGGGFDVLDWNNTFSGSFAIIDLSQAPLDAGLFWDTSQLYVSGELFITNVPPGTQVPMPVWMFLCLGTVIMIIPMSRLGMSGPLETYNLPSSRCLNDRVDS